MKLYDLIRTQHLPITLDQAWQFFTDPYNLLKITPEWLDFRIVSGSGSRLYPELNEIFAFRSRTLETLFKPETS